MAGSCAGLLGWAAGDTGDTRAGREWPSTGTAPEPWCTVKGEIPEGLCAKESISAQVGA